MPARCWPTRVSPGVQDRLVVQEYIDGAGDQPAIVPRLRRRRRPAAGLVQRAQAAHLPAGGGRKRAAGSWTTTARWRTVGKETAARLELRGPFKLDLIRDPRDGRLYVLEVNARFNLWHHLGAAHGVNLPQVAYDYLMHGRVAGAPAGVPAARALAEPVPRSEGAARQGPAGAAPSLAGTLLRPTVHELFAWQRSRAVPGPAVGDGQPCTCRGGAAGPLRCDRRRPRQPAGAGGGAASLDAQAVQDILCLGDLVGYNADSNACVELLRERRAVSIAGNHDLIALGQLGFDRCAPNPEFSLRRTRRRLWRAAPGRCCSTLPRQSDGGRATGADPRRGGRVCQYMHTGPGRGRQRRPPAARCCRRRGCVSSGTPTSRRSIAQHGERIRTGTLLASSGWTATLLRS